MKTVLRKPASGSPEPAPQRSGARDVLDDVRDSWIVAEHLSHVAPRLVLVGVEDNDRWTLGAFGRLNRDVAELPEPLGVVREAFDRSHLAKSQILDLKFLAERAVGIDQ